MSRRILVLASSPVDELTLRDAVHAHAGNESAEVHIVAPIPHTSLLQRLTGDVDKARGEAEEIAHEAAEAVAGEATVEAEVVGDADPMQAIDDALRTFPADELIVVSGPGKQANWLEKDGARRTLESIGLPVTHLVVDRR